MMHHDLRTLRLFAAICELRSLSRAAERMNLALSAASRRLRLFEEEAGAPLVRRLPHGVEPTPAGITALRYAEQVLRLSEQFEAGIAEHQAGVRGRIRVSASSSALVQQLAGDLAEFAGAHPEIRIDLEERPSAETLEALARGQVDLGVVVRGVPSEGYAYLPYLQDRLGVVAAPSHRLAGRGSVAFSQLLDEDFVALEAGTAVDRLLSEQSRSLGRVLRRRVQVRSFEAVCQMVRSGFGLGVLPEAALRPLADALGLVFLRLEEPWAVRHIDLCMRLDREPDLPTRRLVAALRAA
jgi:DNA-binding transcriptional LysR family regulator